MSLCTRHHRRQHCAVYVVLLAVAVFSVALCTAFIARDQAVVSTDSWRRNAHTAAENGDDGGGVALIVETRTSKRLSVVVTNVLRVLPRTWIVQIAHGSANAECVHQVRAHVERELGDESAGRLVFTALRVETLDRDSYNELLFTDAFWRSVVRERVLLFQNDVYFCANTTDERIDAWSRRYALIGAPHTFMHDFYLSVRHWLLSGHWTVHFGNGGASFRWRSCMRAALRDTARLWWSNEDSWFFFALSTMPHCPVAPVSVARMVFVENSLPSEPQRLLAVHQRTYNCDAVHCLCL